MLRLFVCSVFLALIFATVADAGFFRNRRARRSGSCAAPAGSTAGACVGGQSFVR